MNKRIAIIAIVAVLGTAGYLAYRQFFPAATASAGLSASGTVEATEVAVTPLASGRIVSVAATEGARVTKGEALFVLDDSVAKLQVRQAQAGVNAATAARDQAVRDHKSTAEVAAARAQLDQAAAQLELARLQLSYCSVTAPVDGTLLEIALDAGENAAPGKTLATIGRLDALTVSVYVPETEIGTVRLGAPVTVTSDGGATAKGTVTFIASEAEFTPSSIETKDQRVKLVYKVRVSIGGPAGFKPGMPADVTFE